jgi:hypothetical protein
VPCPASADGGGALGWCVVLGDDSGTVRALGEGGRAAWQAAAGAEGACAAVVLPKEEQLLVGGEDGALLALDWHTGVVAAGPRARGAAWLGARGDSLPLAGAGSSGAAGRGGARGGVFYLRHQGRGIRACLVRSASSPPTTLPFLWCLRHVTAESVAPRVQIRQRGGLRVCNRTLGRAQRCCPWACARRQRHRSPGRRHGRDRVRRRLCAPLRGRFPPAAGPRYLEHAEAISVLRAPARRSRSLSSPSSCTVSQTGMYIMSQSAEPDLYVHHISVRKAELVCVSCLSPQSDGRCIRPHYEPPSARMQRGARAGRAACGSWRHHFSALRSCPVQRRKRCVDWEADPPCRPPALVQRPGRAAAAAPTDAPCPCSSTARGRSSRRSPSMQPSSSGTSRPTRQGTRPRTPCHSAPRTGGASRASAHGPSARSRLVHLAACPRRRSGGTGAQPVPLGVTLCPSWCGCAL